MKLKTILLNTVLTGTVTIAFASSAQSQACIQYRGVVTPTSETRVYRNQQLGFSFKLPANYRLMAVKNGVQVLDPNTFEWTQCILRNREATEFKLAPIAVYTTPVNSGVSDLKKIVKTEYPWINSSFSSTTISNQAAITTSYDETLGRERIKDIYLLSPNKKSLIRISGSAQSKVFDLALSTFVIK